MLPTNSIKQIINYFSNNPMFAPAMEEALLNFFEINNLNELEKIKPSKMAFDFFNEWLIFDCLLNNGRTVLEEYLFLNQNQLSPDYKKLYSDLILTQRYSLFRHDSIELGKKITVTDMLSNKRYDIAEKKATYQLVLGSYSFWRIASVGPKFEIVSADGFQIVPEALPLKIIKEWANDKIKFSPLVVYQQMLKPIETGII